MDNIYLMEEEEIEEELLDSFGKWNDLEWDKLSQDKTSCFTIDEVYQDHFRGELGLWDLTLPGEKLIKLECCARPNINVTQHNHPLCPYCPRRVQENIMLNDRNAELEKELQMMHQSKEGLECDVQTIDDLKLQVQELKLQLEYSKTMLKDYNRVKSTENAIMMKWREFGRAKTKKNRVRSDADYLKLGKWMGENLNMLSDGQTRGPKPK